MRLSDHLSKVTWSFADKGLYAGYGLMRLVQVAVMPKSEFGVFSLFDAAFIIMFTIADGFIGQAVVKFGIDDKRRGEVLTLTLLVYSAYNIFVSLAIFALRNPLSEMFHEPRYFEVLTAMPILSLLSIPRTYGAKFFQMLIRTREIFLIDLAWFGTMSVATLLKIHAHSFTAADDLISVNIAGAIGGSITAVVLAAPHARFTMRFTKGHLREMTNFGLIQGSAVLTNIIQQNVDTFFIQSFSNTLQVANYNTARTFWRAFESIRDAVGTVIYPAVARLHVQQRYQELRVLVEKAFSFIFIAMIPVVLACQLGGSDFVFHLFFGAKYNDAIPIFNILALYGLIIPFTQSLVVLTGLGESKAILRIVIIASSVSVASNFLLVPRFQAMGAAMTLILAGLITGGLSTLEVKKSIPFEWNSLFRGFGDGYQFLNKRLGRSNKNSGSH